jgi:hypothetical protein
MLSIENCVQIVAVGRGSKSRFLSFSIILCQAKIKQKCHHGSGVSKFKIYIFIDSTTFGSEKKSHKTFSSKTFCLIFVLDHFELFDCFSAKKGQIYELTSKNVNTCDIVLNRSVLCANFFKFSVFNSSEDIEMPASYIF